MAIKQIPNIIGPSFGGTIYGLNLQTSYSEAPSKLTLNIVNKDGNYNIKASDLNKQFTIKFGNFTFNGILFSYSIQSNPSEKILQVDLIDRSIILDRYWVLLWKKNLLGLNGAPITLKKIFDFRSEEVLVPVITGETGLNYVKFIKTNLGEEIIERPANTLSPPVTIGNVIVIGTEKFRDSRCMIPDTDYNFSELISKLPIAINNARDKNPNYRATYEGTLRDVLGQWCADFGYGYYWDYSLDQLNFFDITKGVVSNIPNISDDPAILSKTESFSMQGTFNQYSIGVTAKPKSAPSELSASKEIVFINAVSPYPISYFMTRKGYSKPIIDDGSTRWGANRSITEFLTSAFCGFVSQGLRNLFCFQNQHWEALGYQINSGIVADKNKIISLLKQIGYSDALSDYEELDGENLPNFDFNYVNFDPSALQKWHDVEQEMLTYIGRFYRVPDSTGNFFYCSPTQILEISVNTEPRPSYQEPKSEDFAGQYIFERNGSMSHSQDGALDELNYDEAAKDIQLCAPFHIDLKESGLIDYLVRGELLTADQAKSVNTLVIFPKSKDFVKARLNFSASVSRGIHPTEPTYQDALSAQADNGKDRCLSYKQTLLNNGCAPAEEEARTRAYDKLSLGQNETEQNYVEGLVSATANYGVINLKGNTSRIYAPSDGDYQVITRYNISIQQISSFQEQELLHTTGDVGTANDVASIRVLVDDLTNSQYDSWGVRRKEDIPRASEVINNTPNQEISYTFAGDPPEGLNLNPSNGLNSLDISLSSDGFTSTANFSTKPPSPPKPEVILRTVNAQISRTSFNGG